MKMSKNEAKFQSNKQNIEKCVYIFFCVASKKLLTFGLFPQNTWSSYEL